MATPTYNVKLKAIKAKNEDGSISSFLYVLIPCTELQSNTMKRTREIEEDILKILKEEEIVREKEDIKGVYHIGELSIFTQYDKMVYQFPLTKRDILQGKETHFRDYNKTVQQQKDSMWLVNTSRTARISYNSAMKKCGSKYGLIAKIEIV